MNGKLNFKLLSAGLLFCVCSWCSPGLFADNRLAYFDNPQERPLVDVLEELGEQYQIFFSYDPKALEKVSVDFAFKKDEQLAAAINRLLSPTNFSYESFGEKYFVIYEKTKAGSKDLKKVRRHLDKIQDLEKKGNLSLERRTMEPIKHFRKVGEAMTSLAAARLTVSGTVTSDEGEALIGVTIMIKGTDQGTTTDIDGKYSLEVEDDNATLVFSYTGFSTQEVAVNGRTTVDLIMGKDVKVLEEVVVVGYGTQKKANLTGAVGVASSEELENRPIASTGMGLQGLVPNLNITIKNGDPSQPADFNIRGYESINGGSPLILVDGVPMDLERINPSDIASVNVLKDASAAAVYGARAAFGVILVETKKGKTGKPKISFNTEWSEAKPILHIDPVTDPHQFVLARNLASQRTDGRPAFDDDYINSTKAWVEGTGPEWGVVNGVLRQYGFNDYQNQLITEFAPQQRHDLTVSGASENANYYVSLGMLNKDGYLRFNNEKFKRYNALMKVDFKVNKWLTLEEKIAFNAQNSDKPHFYNWDVNINTLARVSPIQAIQFPDLPFYQQPGDRDQYEQYIGKYFGGTNFFPYLLDGGRTTFNTNDLWLTQGAIVTPTKGLRLVGNFSYNTFNRSFQDVQSKIEIVDQNLNAANPISNGFSGDDWIINQSDFNQYYVLNTYAEYTLDQFESHYARFTVGYNEEWGRNSFHRAQARQLITPLVTDLNATTGAQQTFGGKSHVALRGAFYRFNYIFQDKYLLEANGRYDGTSRFPSDSRFGFFPSFSVGWRISNEPFMKWSSGWMDNLKLRASYGTLGNQLLGNNFYPYIPTLGIGQAPYIMQNSLIPIVTPAGLVSPTLTWETVTSKNLGLDVTLLNQKLDASFDIFTRDTRDMLTRVELPAILGTGAPQANAADLRTSGWELALTWRDRINQDWNYRATVALSDWTSEITKYNNPTGALNDRYVGQQIGEIWGFVTEGIFQTNEEVAAHASQAPIGANWRAGDIKYQDLNGDGIINRGGNTLEDPGDLTIIGNSTPRYSFGLNLDIGYKGLNIRSFFQGVLKKDYWPTDGNWTWFFPFNAGHVENYFLTDTWTEDNRDAYFPAAHISTNDKKNLQRQSRYIQSAAFARLKNLTLSYDIPAALMQKAKLGSAQVYLAGMNIWEFTKMRKPLDPESIVEDEFGYDNAGAVEYPLQRIYSLGLNVTF